MNEDQIRSAIGVLDRFLDNPQRLASKINITGVPGTISNEFIVAATLERERLRKMLPKAA